MQDLTSLFNRQFFGLASELGYIISEDEVMLYVTTLQEFGLKNVANACLVFRETDYPCGQFPSVNEFKKVLEEL